MRDDINILIVGTGNMASRHLGFVRHAFPNAKIFGYSQIGGTLENVEMLKSLDNLEKTGFLFGIIANAAPFHCKIAAKLLPMPLLIEKPVNNEIEEAIEFYDLVEKHTSKVSIGYHLHHKPSLLKVEELLKSNKIGEIKLVKAEVGHHLSLWRPNSYKNSVSSRKSLGGGVLLELSHDIDYLRHLFGIPKRIACKTYNSGLLTIDPDVEDIALCIFDYDIFGIQLQLDMIKTVPTRKCYIYGTQANIEWDIRNDEIIFFDLKSKKMLKLDNEIKKLANKDDVYIRQLNEFVSWINGNSKANIVTLSEAIDTLKIISLMKLSNQTLKFEMVL